MSDVTKLMEEMMENKLVYETLTLSDFEFNYNFASTIGNLLSALGSSAANQVQTILSQESASKRLLQGVSQGQVSSPDLN